MTTYIKPVPFAPMHRVVMSDGVDEPGYLAVESLDGIDEFGEEVWVPVQIFSCSSRVEALGIASAFAPTVKTHLRVDQVVNAMTNRLVRVPGTKRGFMIYEVGDDYEAALYDIAADTDDVRRFDFPAGALDELDHLSQAHSFFEAYGWALATAMTWSRG